MKKKKKTQWLLIPVLAFVLVFGPYMSTVAAENTTDKTTEVTTTDDAAVTTTDDATVTTTDDAAVTTTDDATVTTTDDAAETEEMPSQDEVDFTRFGIPDNSDGLNDTLSAEFDTTTADTFVNYCKIAIVVAGIVAVAIGIIFILLALKKRGRGGKGFNISSTIIAVVLLTVVIVGQWATSYYAAGINNVFSKTTSSSNSTVTTTESDWLALTDEIASQGMVLLKNENNVLPLTTNKVNLLGYCAYNPVYSGSGSSSVSASDAISIVTGLEDSGIEINPATAGAYTVTDAEDKGIGFSESSFSIDEVPISNYTGDASFESMKAYSDTAIVVFGRTGGEGSDLTSYGEVDGTNYLQLNQNERDLLEQASTTFKHVIVVINSGNALETGFLEEYGIEACIWSGMPGPYGFEALGQILTGEVNPSGKLPDTWAYDNYSAPATENYGDQVADNSSKSHYVDYVEDIYVGYKWYETAFAESAKITNTKTGVDYDYSNYNSIVAFPFGYGLSYSTFDQKIVGGTLVDGTKLDSRGSYTLEIEVSNTGGVVGKDAVQVYVTVPYTDYDKENGVEKSDVSLCGVAKTGDIQPGESETVTITIPMEDIASYDTSYNNGDTTGSYMLDAGDYTFSVRSDSHTVYNQVTAQLDSQYFFSGENKRDTDEQAAYNEFTDVARGKYLSRQDSFANYEEAMNSVSSNVESTAFEDNPAYYDTALDDMVTKTYKKGVDYAADGDLTLVDMVGLDFNDQRWDKLVSQLTLEDLQNLVTDATYTSPAITAINKSKTCDTDGALGISSMFNAELTGTAYPCIPLLAATFNKELAYEMGLQVADQCHNFGITGWYAPAMDTHRTAFSGRNFEYYSEDGFLGGTIGAAEASGARDKGLIVYVKHFALNDQETNRGSNLHTYSNEQAIREIYLKPFEITIKNADVTAIMNSMNFVGDTYAACYEPLMIEVLRNEWGFHGKVLTDMTSDSTCVNAALRAGTDSWLSIFALEVNAKTDADIYYLQRTAHNILYMEANAVLAEVETINWHIYLNIVCIELLMAAAACVIALFIRNKKLKV